MGAAAFAALIFIWAAARRNAAADKSLAKQLGLPEIGPEGRQQIQSFVSGAREEIAKVGPVKLSLVALVVGLVLARQLKN